MKKVLSLCIAFVLLLGVAITANASYAYRLLDDGAGLLTQEEGEMLEDQLQRIYAKTDAVTAVVTVNGLSERIGDFADGYFDAHYGSDTDGILLALDMEERAWYISTNGKGRVALPDREIDDIAEKFLPSLSRGEYFDAFTVFADDVLDRIESLREEGRTPEAPGNPDVSGEAVVITLAVAFVISLIAVLIMKGKLRPVRHKTQAADYVVPGSMQMKESRDIYLFTTTTRTRRQSSSNTTGGHSGSHGGGGGHF